jgi:hypothetical protein
VTPGKIPPPGSAAIAHITEARHAAMAHARGGMSPARRGRLAAIGHSRTGKGPCAWTLIASIP